jgi:hypothetical protein
VADGSGSPGKDVTHIRDIALLPGERVTHVFSPDRGLTDVLPVEGQVLITTDRRILAFSQVDGRHETFLAPLEELKGVSVKTSARTPGSLFQGILLTLGAIFLYLVIAYWLTGRLEGPGIPFINIDLAPFLVLLLILLGVLLAGKHYFAKKAGSVTFQGSAWVFAFPCRGNTVGQEIYQVVNSVFAARQSGGGYSFLWEE